MRTLNKRKNTYKRNIKGKDEIHTEERSQKKKE